MGKKMVILDNLNVTYSEHENYRFVNEVLTNVEWTNYILSFVDYNR